MAFEPADRGEQAHRLHSRGVLVRVAVLVGAVAVVAGALGGHAIWSSTSTVATAPLVPATAGKQSTAVSRVGHGLVDIDTNLYQGGAAAGTGMVVSASGEVITNNHVITGATAIKATDVGNGRTYGARVIGYDHSHDVAVLALTGASGLATVAFANSSTASVGEHIVTVGNAGGVGGTPSAAAGSIVALNQSIIAGDEFDGSFEQLNGLIEINGDLAPGDSGGPLVNSAGNVLGMDTAASASFQFQSNAGQGFAIPSNNVEAIAKLIAGGHASEAIHIGATAFLGVQVFTGNQRYGFPGSQGSPSTGALVEEVISDTPAANAGLTAGDTITALDGRAITSASGLTDALELHHPGDRVQLTWQDIYGSQHTATATLITGPAD